ncbi:hypothetical protein ACJX0J_035236, partial [Zea mays]
YPVHVHTHKLEPFHLLCLQALCSGASLCEFELNYDSCREQLLIIDEIALHQGWDAISIFESVNADPSNYLDLLELYNAATEKCLSDLSEESCEYRILLHNLLNGQICITGTLYLVF